MTIGERFKELRIALNMTQEDVANTLGLSRQTISGIEHDRAPLTSQTILVYKAKKPIINDDWLRTGAGDMFVNEEDEDAELNAIIEDLIKNGAAPFVRQFLRTYSKLSDESKRIVSEFFAAFGE